MSSMRALYRGFHAQVGSKITQIICVTSSQSHLKIPHVKLSCRSSLLRHIKSKHKTVALSSGKENNSSVPNHFQCSTCQKAFKFRTHLINHEKTHTKPYKCGQCDETFAEATKLASHEMNVHGEVIASSVTSSALIKCCFCPKVFPARSQALLHERTHTKERPFQCSICSKRFAAKCNLTAHERIHAGESKRLVAAKYFVCFNTNYSLNPAF